MLSLVSDSLRHHVLGIALACGGVFRKDLVQVGKIFLRQGDVHRCGIFFQKFSALRARDRDNVVALRQHPGESQLRWLAMFLDRKVFYLVHQV